MSDPAAAQSPAASSLSVAQQAILDETRSVYGYELFDRSVLPHQHTAASDAQMLFNVLSSVETDALLGRKHLFLNCTHDSLAGGHLDLVAPEHVVLEIPQLPISQVDQVIDRLPALKEMQRRGFRLSFDYSILTRSYEPWLELASFIKFDLSALKPATVDAFVRLALVKSKAQLIAEKVETPQQHAAVAELGVKLFQGYWFARPVLLESQKIRPAQATILQLISLIRQQASTNEIEELLKRDPTLSFNLLRFINSASFGMRTEVTSFKHAVMLLGLKRLFKWAVLLMTTSNKGDTPPAVGSTAVVRGRLMELLAANLLPPDECDNAFVVGVFSLLDAMLGVPMETALASVSLPASVSDALLHKTGDLAPLLSLVMACESGDDAAFAQASFALRIDGNDIARAQLQAIAWADNLG